MLKLVKLLNRKQKRNILLLVDLVLVPLALIFTYGVQTNPSGPLETLQFLLPILPYLLAVAAGLSIGMGIPQIQLNAYEGRALAKTGLFAIYMGAALAGYPLALVMEYYHWSGFFTVISAAAAVVGLLLLPFLKAQETEGKETASYEAAR